MICFVANLNGAWSAWSQWSQCDVACGGGQQVALRTCTDPPPRGTGLTCPGSGTKSKACNTQACGKSIC